VEVSVDSLKAKAREMLDVAAALGIRQPGLSTLVGDHDQGWGSSQSGTLDEFGLLVGVDVEDLEGLGGSSAAAAPGP